MIINYIIISYCPTTFFGRLSTRSFAENGSDENIIIIKIKCHWKIVFNKRHLTLYLPSEMIFIALEKLHYLRLTDSYEFYTSII